MSSSAEATAQRRRALLALGWPSSERVGNQLGFATEPAKAAAELRAAGRLLGVWSSEDRTYLHPDFQFSSDGSIRRDVAKLLTVLPVDGDAGGWRRAFWLFGVREALDGKCPADVFVADPDRVLALAHFDFFGDE